MLSGPRQERGFTLVELVVAMIVLAIMVGGVVYAVANLGRGSSNLAANRAAQRDALEAMEQMRQDLNAARSPGLELFDDRKETLRDLIWNRIDRNPSADDRSRQTCGGSLSRGVGYISCLSAVTYASPTELWFRADVGTAAGASCIGYVVTDGELRRTVSSNWRGCRPGLAPDTQTVLLKAKSLASTRGGGIFRYTARMHPGPMVNNTLDPAGCRSYQYTNQVVPDASRPRPNVAFISNVTIDLSGIVTNRNEAAAGGLVTSSVITAHTAGDYAFATGCAG